MAAGFVFHTIGLGLRWYISGRAPWSNGYESMIYIGWTTMLAGTLISRKSLGGLAATATLAATILLVASMSWLDPEITPLVPVLKSYWLTIHVSLEAGSYGFLMLGAVIGMLNLVLMILINEKNKENVVRAIKELTIISEITLLAGLTMISIGTYLGGVWANESWGRYWGWDAKETWALVTIFGLCFYFTHEVYSKVTKYLCIQFCVFIWLCHSNYDLFWCKLLLVWITLVCSRRPSSNSFWSLLYNRNSGFIEHWSVY